MGKFQLARHETRLFPSTPVGWVRKQALRLLQSIAIALLGWLNFPGIAVAEAEEVSLPFVHSLFCDHMVIQRDKKVPVWGWATPNSSVTITISGQTSTATVDKSGRWRVGIGPLAAGGPYVLEIVGETSVSFEDVLVGDVWLCSGQSNMEMPVRRTDHAKREIAESSHPNIRLFQVARKIAKTPFPTVEGKWETCGPHSIGRFSAAAYYFARELQPEVGVPIGLIHSSWGGTPAEAWSSAKSLNTLEEFREVVADVQQGGKAAERLHAERMKAWWTKCESPHPEGKWRGEPLDDSDWKTMAVPQLWEEADVGLEAFDGVVRFRRAFDLPAELLESAQQGEVLLSLGRMNDVDTTWVNGHRVGGENSWDTPRRYRVPAKYLKAGKNVIAACVCDVGGSGGMYGDKKNFTLDLSKLEPGRKISLEGDWRYLVGAEASQLPGLPPSYRSHNSPTALYNGMIAPLVPFGIRGALWYQGESNAGRPEQYGRLLPKMIAGWRGSFEQEFPFLIVQLANFRALQKKAVEPGWAEIRDVQRQIADDDPKNGLVVITDIGLADDVHPTNKQDVGKRLAALALAIEYDKDVLHAGPTYRQFVQEGKSIRVQFASVGQGLAVHGDKLTGFAIAGAKGDFVWADARVDGNEVLLSAEGIDHPKRVRYNWANNPLGNLFNQAGWPAAPFRSDE